MRTIPKGREEPPTDESGRYICGRACKDGSRCQRDVFVPFCPVICIEPNRGNSSMDSPYHEHRPGLGLGNRWRENRRLARRFYPRIRRWMERGSGIRTGQDGRRPSITTVGYRRSRPASVLGRSSNERSMKRRAPDPETVGAGAGKGGAETTEIRYGAGAPVMASVRRPIA